jgi:hypothetical protein
VLDARFGFRRIVCEDRHQPEREGDVAYYLALLDRQVDLDEKGGLGVPAPGLDVGYGACTAPTVGPFAVLIELEDGCFRDCIPCPGADVAGFMVLSRATRAASDGRAGSAP